MATVIIGITDTHWTERRPRSRTDLDWIDTQTRKINQVYQVARDFQAQAIVHAGDLFHQPQGRLISRRVDTWLLAVLGQAPCPWLVIPGNHDMKGQRLDSLEDHPYGCLVASRLVTQVVWPQYTVIGTDPPVIVTGREFTADGVGPWLDELRQTQVMYDLRDTIAQEYNQNTYILGLVHGWFSETAGECYGEPAVALAAVAGTGCDAVLAGHDHALGGITPVVEDWGGWSYVVRPGALVRGTLAETDVNRIPQIVVMVFNTDGKHNFQLIPVECAPATTVFDFNKHNREKKRKLDEQAFVSACRQLDNVVPSLEVILSSLESVAGVTPRAMTLARELLVRVEGGE